jgi:hypothetical protein
MPPGSDFGPALCSSTLSSVAASAFASSHIHHDHSLHGRRQHIPTPVVKRMIAEPDNIGTRSEESAVVHCLEDTAVFRRSNRSDREVGLDTGVSREAARGASIECLLRYAGHSKRLMTSFCACSTSQRRSEAMKPVELSFYHILHGNSKKSLPSLGKDEIFTYHPLVAL